ncbi:MAG: beta-eliminating lyase-related protein [Gemmatimonadales bacterium]|nr:beta-eliminating lyase-related protein [Gemmatimonadales bacterium]
MLNFASDNVAPAHPAVLEALARANVGPARAYGDDPLTRAALDALRAHFGAQASPWLVWGGTGANVAGLAALLRPWEAVLCAGTAHIRVDETGAVERFTGSSVLTVRTPDGKLSPEAVRPLLRGFGVQHHPQPRVLSVTQTTEYGTAYTVDELAALVELAHAHGMLVHLDGARLANAAATLGLPVAAFTAALGVDVVSVGFTKPGALAAEAVVFLREGLDAAFPYIRKQALQLASKQRYVAAQVLAMLEDDRWIALAAHANAMARRLADAVRDLPAVTVTQRVEANAVFACLPRAAIVTLQREALFYDWDEACNEVRWMTSWDTTPGQVDTFAAAIRAATAG